MATYFTDMFAGPISQMTTARVKEERPTGVPRYSPTPKQRDGARMGSQPVQRQKTKEPLTLCHVQHEAQPRGSGRRPGRGPFRCMCTIPVSSYHSARRVVRSRLGWIWGERGSTSRCTELSSTIMCIVRSVWCIVVRTTSSILYYSYYVLLGTRTSKVRSQHEEPETRGGSGEEVGSGPPAPRVQPEILRCRHCGRAMAG